MNVNMFVECGIWEIFRLFPSCHDGLGLSVLIQSHYYWLFLYPSKSKRRDVAIVVAISLVYVLFDPVPSLLHSSILFNCFYTCFCSFLMHLV